MSISTQQRTTPAAPRSVAVPRGPLGLGGAVVRWMLVGGMLAVVVFWWAGTPASAGVTPGGALTSTGELAGLLAAFLVCAQLVLVGRVPWFERAVGLDRLVSWHRSLGTTVLLLVTTHVALMVLGGALLDRTALWPEALSLIATQPEMLSAVVGTALFVVVGLSSARLLRRYLSYEVWFVVHLSIYVGIYLTFGHQIAAGTHFVGALIARAAWLTLYVTTGAALVTWRVVLPLLAHRQRLLRVTAVVPESTGMASVWLTGRNLDQLAVRGGQFFLVRFLTKGHLWTAHPYSVSMVPTTEHLRFTIAKLGNHSGAVANLRTGTPVLVEGPFGRFTADQATSRRVLLVAGGAGIGPIRALAEDLVLNGNDIVVLHRAHSPEHLGLGDELAASPALRYVALAGRRTDLGYDPLDSAHLQNLVPDIASRDVFICGPEGMTGTVVRAAHAAGVPRSAIHHEELSLS